MTRTVGPYELLKRIAVGGAAEIYLARKSGLLGFEQHYALKVLLPHREDDEDHRKMMIDEARLTAQLDHPNIVKVHDLGEDGTTLFMVMEYVNGLNLAQIMARLHKLDRQMPVEVAVYITREMCGGLHYAHTRKTVDGAHLRLVHRDVSPQNLLVGFGGEIKLIDFGVAKAAVGGRLETKTGIIKGKLTYMAPEYAVGSQQDHRSDIFAVGLVLYEMLTGRAAYDIEDARELVEAVKKAQIQRPSKHREGVPPGLEQLLEKALEQRPDDRWESAQQLQQSLTQFLSIYAPEFRKEQLGDWIAELRDAEGRPPAEEADTNPELPNVDEDEVLQTAPAEVVTRDADTDVLGDSPPTQTNTEYGMRAMSDEEEDMDSLVATQSLDLESTGLKRRRQPTDRKTVVGMGLSEHEGNDDAAESGKQSRKELLSGVKRRTLEAALKKARRTTDPDDVPSVVVEDESTSDTEVLPPGLEIPALAEDESDDELPPGDPTEAAQIKIQREFPTDDELAMAPTTDLDLGAIAPDRAVPSSELPTAMNLQVDEIRGEIVPQRVAQPGQPEILTQSGFQAFAQRPAPADPNADPLAVTGKSDTGESERMLSGTAATRPDDAVDMLPAPNVMDEGSPHEGLPAVIVGPESDPPSEPLPPMKKHTPGLIPPAQKPEDAEARLSDSATALIGRFSERYEEYSKTESGRKTTDAFIVAVLGLTLFLVIMFTLFFAN